MEIPLGACPTTVNSSVFSLVLVNFPGEIPAFDPGFACRQIPLGGFSLVVFFCPYANFGRCNKGSGNSRKHVNVEIVNVEIVNSAFFAILVVNSCF